MGDKSEYVATTWGVKRNNCRKSLWFLCFLHFPRIERGVIVIAVASTCEHEACQCFINGATSASMAATQLSVSRPTKDRSADVTGTLHFRAAGLWIPTLYTAIMEDQSHPNFAINCWQITIKYEWLSTMDLPLLVSTIKNRKQLKQFVRFMHQLAETLGITCRNSTFNKQIKHKVRGRVH